MQMLHDAFAWEDFFDYSNDTRKIAFCPYFATLVVTTMVVNKCDLYYRSRTNCFKKTLDKELNIW